jgi:lipoate-protein ligase A
MRLLIELDPTDPRRGLATDEALLESVRSGAEAAVRLWVNDRAVVVGRSQSASDEVDGAFAGQNGIPVLRRISGGGTVYHYPGNLNVSIVLRDGRRIGSVRETFQFFGDAIAAAIAEICPTVSPNENALLIGEAKLGGAAQARRGNALLYHTTLLVAPADVPMERLLLAMRPGYRPRRVASRPRRTVSLSEAIGRDVPMKRVAEGLATPLSETLAEPLLPCRLDSREEHRVGRLAETKYGDPRWNRSL